MSFHGKYFVGELQLGWLDIFKEEKFKSNTAERNQNGDR